MVDNGRFLSIRLGPHHSGRVDGTAGLVLELVDGQWGLYSLDASDKIKACLSLGSLENAQALAQQRFGVRPEEWIEDSPN